MAGQDHIAMLLEGRQLDEIAGLLDTAELQSLAPNVLEVWPAALHLLGHLYNGQLADARMLWKRLPAEAKAGNAELDAVRKVLQYAWAGQYAGVLQALSAFAWSPDLQPLVGALIMRTREKAVQVISQGYSTIRVATAAALTGLPESQAKSLCVAEGWSVDDATGTVTVTRRAVDDEARDGHANLQQLAEYMVHLEH